MSIEITTATAAELVGIRGALELVADGSPSFVRDVFTQAQFIAANAESGSILIRLCADITLPVGTITIAAEKTVEFNAFKFVSPEGAAIFFYGLCSAGRRQIFSGFDAGAIRGTFGHGVAYPEWWGLTDGRHDLAINAAIQASPLLFSNIGIVISLAARVYNVARPINLFSTASALVGAGSNRTYLRATSAWTADVWRKSELWGDPEDANLNHSGMVLMGSDTGSVYSFRTQVRGMEIECYEASYAHRATKRVSGISSPGGVEECSVIDDVSVVSASGMGIGFCRHRNTEGNYVAATVNGLSITNFWITGPTMRDAYGMYFSQWSYDYKVDVGTIDMRLDQSISSAWVTTEPDWIRTYPLIGIKAQGNGSISNVHFEGMVIGVHVEENSGAGNTPTLRNLDFYYLSDPIRGAVYASDGLSGADFVDETAVTAANLVTYTNSLDTARYFGYGTGVLISKYPYTTGTSGTPWNVKDRVTVSCIGGTGGTTYLLRDAMYNVNVRCYGMGQYPATSGGGISFYSRGNAYARQTTIPYAAAGDGAYDPADPGSVASISRQFFIGPIY